MNFKHFLYTIHTHFTENWFTFHHFEVRTLFILFYQITLLTINSNFLNTIYTPFIHYIHTFHRELIHFYHSLWGKNTFNNRFNLKTLFWTLFIHFLYTIYTRFTENWITFITENFVLQMTSKTMWEKVKLLMLNSTFSHKILTISNLITFDEFAGENIET